MIDRPIDPSDPRLGRKLTLASTLLCVPNQQTTTTNGSSSSSVGGHKHLAPVPPHGGGVSASPSSSSLSSKLHAHAHPDADEADPEARVYHGHRPSFRVIGVQISHLSRTGQFVFCTFGVFFFLLIYGFLQVRGKARRGGAWIIGTLYLRRPEPATTHPSSPLLLPRSSPPT